MTTPVPVTDDDIVSGGTKYLLAQPDVVAAVDTFTIGGQVKPGIFGYRSWATLEGSSKTCIVLSSDTGWAGANTYNTLRFPRLVMNIWADPIRDAGGHVIYPGEVMQRAAKVFRVVDRYLHLTGGPEVYFGQLRVISSTRLTEPTIFAASDGDGLIRSQTVYAVTEG